MFFSLLLGILWIGYIIYVIKTIFERDDLDRNTQLLWTILIVVAPVLGIIIYYLFGDHNRD